MKNRIAVVAGIRSPFCKASGVFNDIEVDDLGAYVVRELIARTGVNPKDVDELIFGNVMEPPHKTNIARFIAVKSGLPVNVPAFTVNRNCASGLEAIITAMNRIKLGDASIIIAGGAESMSSFPVTFSKKMRDFLVRFNKSKTFSDKLKNLLSLRPSFFKPVIPSISDPLCDLSMGQTAEIIARELKVSREEMDNFAYLSQQRASNAIKSGRLKEEIVPIPLPPKYEKTQEVDDGPRDNQTIEALNKLKPVFEKVNGMVTAGNSSQVTDGAVAILLMSEEKAKELGYKPLAYISEYSAVGLDPSRMGLGPAYAISKLLKKTDLQLNQIDLIEINEAFAGQVIACKKALASESFCKNQLGLNKPVGDINLENVNVNGGAVAIGHPLGASGARLVLTLAIELNKQNKKRGIASLCVGGGQGEALLVEV